MIFVANRGAADAFAILAQRGDLPEAFLPRVQRMVRFRNLVVHGDLHIRSAVVERIVAEDLGDFAAWEALVSRVAGGEQVPGEEGDASEA